MTDAPDSLDPAGPWLHPDITVGRSVIAGSGLFAGTPIAEGATVVRGEWSGPVTPNHSCDPTLWWAGEHTLIARRDIAAGDELTIDYATSTDSPSLMLACHCETYRCRQLIAGDDWQIPQLQLRYAGHWAASLQQRIDAQH